MEDYEIIELKRRLAVLLEERQMWRRTHMALTDEEREAIEMAYSRLTSDANHEAVAATLRWLLKRTA
jgi:hypothetical protein